MAYDEGEGDEEQKSLAEDKAAEEPLQAVGSQDHGTGERDRIRAGKAGENRSVILERREQDDDEPEVAEDDEALHHENLVEQTLLAESDEHDRRTDDRRDRAGQRHGAE